MGLRNVSVLILFNSGKMLLQHREDDAVRLPGYWAFFGGGLEEGETPLEGLKREIKEEIDYDVKNPKLIATQDPHNEGYKDSSGQGLKYIYIEEYGGEELQLNEGQGMEWFTFEETENLKIADHDRATLKLVAQTISEIASCQQS